GGIATMRTYVRTDGEVNFTVRVRLPAGMNPFRVKRKARRYNPTGHWSLCRTIVSVEPSREVASVCIRVAAADHLYATEHCILTHNTTSAACSARALQERGRPTLILAPSYLSAVWRAELDALGFLSDGAGEGSNLF